MLKKYAGRYSKYLRPISIIFDLSTINFLIVILFSSNFSEPMYFIIFSLFWIISAYITRFYEVYRFTKLVTIISHLITQGLLFTIIVFAFFGFIESQTPETTQTIKYISLSFVAITFFKFLVFYGLQSYRLGFGGNFRKTIIIGNNDAVKELESFFANQKELGYENRKTFRIKKGFSIQDCFEQILNLNIDEVYCSVSELDNDQIKILIDFCNNNFKILKFISARGELLSKKLKSDTYGYSTVQSFRDMPLTNDYNIFLKRSFDIVFSLTIIIGILSWLIPLMALLIKIESNGPVFFLQKRNGYRYKEFLCIKFRSMIVNKDADTEQAKRGDIRVTRLGKFIRKRSIDELPQFFNVLIGNMSVVGPRPHMITENKKYAKTVNKFMVRHFVKPGISGLAQVKGYRGEIAIKSDIVNRIKYDLYYIENWSFLLDLKIITLTILNSLKGEKKAY